TTGYFIDVSTNSNFSNFVTGYNNFSTGNVVNTNITGLTLNTTYYYRIRANNGIGTSPNSNVISVTTSNIAPSAPTAIAATNIASTSFTANWQIVNNATEYRIDLSQNSSFSSFVGNYNNLSVGNVQNINITGLVMNTTYFYRIRAINSIGTSLNSNVIQVTTLNNNVAAKPIAVTGFNHDIIANGAGGANRALTSTTNDFGTFVLYSKDFRGNNNQTSAPKYGLADNGKIINANRPGYDFQLANYTGNNALLLKNVNESGTLSLVSQDTVSSFVILATSENGISNVNALATFSDGTNTPFTFSINDWFGQPNFAIKGIGRITRSNDIFDSGESAEDPRLYNHEVVFPGPFSSKRLVSISFTKTSSTGSLAILAITGIFKESVQDCKLTIPDANFKSYLISNSNININGDNAIQCSEAENFTGEIICPNLQIKDLTGIEEFPNLSILQCNDNELSKLDLSKNRKLIKLSCNNNQIDKLNLSANPLLIEVFCSSNQLTSINLEQNLLLQTFDCNTNNIGFLDISKNTSLTMLRCYTNKLSSLNLANGINEDMNLIEANNNPGLSCIKVDNAEYSKSNWITSSFKFDPQHEFKLECDACDEWRERLNSNFLISSDACVGDSIHLIDYSKIELDSSIVFAWNFGNGITSKERDPVISYSAEGNYKISLQLENPSCKSFEIQKSISIKSCLTGIGVSLNSAILYPNPNSGDIVLDINLNESSPVSIQVCNSNGKMVKEYEFSEFKVFEEKISIDDSGIYFIVIKHKQGIINLKTIVVK
ncbi:MAG: fibronectin type III domain-containing protein, partial [Saprospiraceae bacterium]|nr:fibronectin type III domain-containing protein [Saprospiraceae bacterium]